METTADEEQPLNFSKSATNLENAPGTSLTEKCNLKSVSLSNNDSVSKLPLLKHSTSSTLLMPSSLLPPNYINGSFVAAAAVSAAMNAAATCRQLTNSINSTITPTVDANSVAILNRTSTLLATNRCPTSSPTLLCAVCGDISSGKHYGILACNGCSGFFKRSVRRRLIYRCQAGTGSCIVDKTHRNQCQACRLRKCLSKGMNKDAVQNERQPRSTATIRITDDASTSSSSSNSESPFSTGFLAKNILSNSTSSMFKNNNNEQVYCLERTTTSDEFSRSESVYEIAAKVLYIAVKWVKDFSALSSLPIGDQLLCLEDAWTDLFLLSVMQWSVSLENDNFILTATLFPGKEHIQCLEDVFYQIKALNITQDEFICLKTVLLLNSGIRGLKKPLQVQELQDRTQRMLQKYSSSVNSTRFGRLLLLLPQLRVVSKEKVEEALFRPIFGGTSVVKIIYAMYRGKPSQ